jgi:HEAT repeat protein
MEGLTQLESWVSEVDYPEFHDAEARIHAAAGLATSFPTALVIRRGVPALRRASAEGEPAVRAAAAAAVQAIEQKWADSPAVREVVIKEFDHGSILYRDGVEFFDQHDVMLLVEALADAEVRVRRAAARTLRNEHARGLSDYTEEIVESLVRALNDDDVAVRRYAAGALVSIGIRLDEAQEARPPIFGARTLVHWAKICACGWGVDAFRKVAVPALAKTRRLDSDESVRAAAGHALLPHRPARKLLVPTILKAFQHPVVGPCPYDPVDAVLVVLEHCDAAETAKLAATVAAHIDDGDWHFRRRVRRALAAIDPNRIPDLNAARISGSNCLWMTWTRC